MVLELNVRNKLIQLSETMQLLSSKNIELFQIIMALFLTIWGKYTRLYFSIF